MSIIKLPANSQALVEIVYDKNQSKFDVLSMEYNYMNGAAFPAAWAYYKFEEESGTRYDSSGNGNHLHDGIEGYTPSSNDTGKIGNCIKFVHDDGSPGLYADISWVPSGGLFTFAFWFKATGGGSSRSACDINSNIDIDMKWNADGSKFKIVVAGDYYYFATGYDCNPDTWYFIVIYGDGTGVFIDVNNTCVASDTQYGPELVSNYGVTYIAASGYAGQTCWLDELWIGPTCLTSEQRTQLYNGGAGWSPY